MSELTPDVKTDQWALYFGGPDKPAGRLRDVLGAMIDAQPPKATIHFATYYFRDPVLAAKLVDAHQRGVEVSITIESRPRQADANRRIVDFFQQKGMGDSLRLHGAGPIKHRGHLHSKIYTFSHPAPSVFIGSFNPSGTDMEDDPLLAAIGDQDRGHNLLYHTCDQKIALALTEHTCEDKWLSRLTSKHNNPLQSGRESLYFFPRLKNAPLAKAIDNVSSKATIWAAISHMKGNPLIGALVSAANKGARVRLIVHDTKRRVPEKVVSRARNAGIDILRYAREDHLPMHAKFLLVEDGDVKSSWLGSYNHNSTSQWLNHEILLKSRNADLFDALKQRFDFIAAEIETRA